MIDGLTWIYPIIEIQAEFMHRGAEPTAAFFHQDESSILALAAWDHGETQMGWSLFRVPQSLTGEPKTTSAVPDKESLELSSLIVLSHSVSKEFLNVS